MKTIFSFSGGGSRGLISLKLANKIPFLPDFVSGTSTGGIIAAALSIDMSYDKIIYEYKNELPNIFKPKLDLSFGLMCPKYDKNNLYKSLKNIFKDKTTLDCKIPLMINTFDLSNKQEYHFKSWKDNEKLVDILMSTTAALTYFFPNNMYAHQQLDGGHSNNNICYDAYIEAQRMFSDKEIQVFSIGTGIIPKENKIEIKNGGLIEASHKAIPIFLAANNTRETYYMKHNKRDKDIYENINVILNRNIELDDISDETISYMLNTDWRIIK